MSNVCFENVMSKGYKMNEDFDLKDKAKSDIVLNYLNKGGVLEVNGNLLCMAEDDQLCFLVEDVEGEQTLYLANITFNQFINMCNELSDEYIRNIMLFVARPRGHC